MRYFRKSLIILVVIGCVAVVYLAYEHIHKLEQNQIHAEDLIPDDAVFVYQSDKIIDDWNRLSSTSILWENIRSNDMLIPFITQASVTDSLITNNIRLEEIVNDRTSSISMHYADNKTSYLYLLQLKPKDDPDEVLSLIDESFPHSWEKTSANVSDVKFSLYSSKDIKLYIGSYRNIIIACESEELLVKAMLLKNSDGNSALRKMTKSSGHGFDIHGNIYVNFHYLNYFLKNTLPKSPLIDLKLDNWLVSDVLIKPKSILLNGVLENDNKGLLNQLSGLPNYEPMITRFIPHNVAGFVRITLPEDASLTSTLAVTDSTTLIDHINEVNNKAGIDINYHLLSWLATEAAAISDVEGNLSWVYPVSNAETSIHEKLIDYSSKVSEFYNFKSDSSEYKGFLIMKSALPFGYNNVHGKFFDMPEQVWMACSEDVVYISGKKQNLMNLIGSLGSGSLLNDANYKEQTSQFMSASCSFLMYGKPFYLTDFLKEYLGQPGVDLIRTKHPFFSNITFSALQIVSSDKQLPINIVVSYNASEKESSEYLWDTQLADGMYGTPHVIYNHRSKSKNILVQDKSNTIYLLTNTGSIQWKKQLNGPIMGHVEQIDIFANGKLQMVCNTQSSLYVIDVLGRDVKGFPVKLKNKASAPFQVFDYEKDNDYRILIPCGKHIVNYNKEGEEVNGWTFEASLDSLKGGIYHSIIQSMDIIFTYDKNGNLYFLNRRGENRKFDAKTIHKAIKFKNNNLFFEKSNSLVTSKIIYLDSTGHIISSYLGGTRDSLEVIAPSNTKILYYTDVDGDNSGDYIIRNKNQVIVFKKNKTVLFTYKTADIDELYISSDGKSTFIGLYNEPSSSLRVLDSKGNLIGKNKLTATGGFYADDINKDGIIDLIYCSTDNHIRAFSLK